MTSAPQLKITQFIKGRRERVFQAWLKPELAVQWFSPENLTPLSFHTDAKVGGIYVHVMITPEGQKLTTTGKYLEIVENKKIVFTWGKEILGITDSIVTVELTDQDDGTLVTLSQIKLPDEIVPGHIKGWESALRHMEKFFKGETK
jgi:uncharacterized protein YndB with AHSA1/START domain